LGEVAEEEDTGECGDTKSDGGDQLGCEGLPELALREEVEDALEGYMSASSMDGH
jgi:hypothetical protein